MCPEEGKGGRETAQLQHFGLQILHYQCAINTLKSQWTQTESRDSKGAIQSLALRRTLALQPHIIPAPAGPDDLPDQNILGGSKPAEERGQGGPLPHGHGSNYWFIGEGKRQSLQDRHLFLLHPHPLISSSYMFPGVFIHLLESLSQANTALARKPRAPVLPHPQGQWKIFLPTRKSQLGTQGHKSARVRPRGRNKKPE